MVGSQLAEMANTSSKRDRILKRSVLVAGMDLLITTQDNTYWALTMCEAKC